MGLSRFSDWIWPGSRTTRRSRDAPAASSVAIAMAGALFPDSPSGFREPTMDTHRGPTSSGGGARRARKGSNRRRSREVVDREHDMVIVPPDGGGGDGYSSDSGSDDSDWSIGWLEPQGPELHSDGDSDGSFAVLVPCYRHRRRRVEEPGRGRLADGNVSGGKNFVERWLSSLPN